MTSTYNPGVHRYSVFVVCWTILLLVAGALVTSKDAALSVTDWPKSHGTWVPALSALQGGDFFEFSHRFIAGGLGIFTLLLAVLLLVKDSRAWLRWLGVVTWTAVALRKRFGASRELGKACILLHSIFGAQFLLGLLAYWSRLTTADAPQPMPVMVWLTVIHTVVGAILFAFSVLVVLLCYRLIPHGREVATAAREVTVE